MKIKKFKISYIIIIIILILISFVIINSTSGFTTPLESYDIVIIAGQSNSIGYGTRLHSNIYNNPARPPKYGAVSQEDSPDNSIKLFCNDRIIRNAAHPFDHLTGWRDRRYTPPKLGSSVGNSSLNSNPVGFGLTFAKEYLKNTRTNSKVLLVGCGYGGTGFSSPHKLSDNYAVWWRPTDDNNYSFTEPNMRGTVKSLYLMTKEKITEMRERVGPNSRVVAILWNQGESDSAYCMLNQSNKNTYIQHINTLFTNLRNDISSLFQNSINIPILLGGLSPELVRKRNASHSFRPGMNSTSGMTYFIKNSVVPSISNAYFVSSEPISGSSFTDYLEGDNEVDANGDPYRDSSGKIIRLNQGHVHISATSQREFGKRYAYIFNSIPSQ